MDLDYFKKIRILDGGMGQELLARGMKPNGTLWSANALLNENYHDLLLNTHLDYIKSGADVICTTTFTTRRVRLRDNGVEEKFEYLNKKAGEIAKKAQEKYPLIKIAGELPPQNFTYEVDNRETDLIRKSFNEQAKILNPYVDFFILHVISSIREFKCAIEAIKEFKKPYLIGIHISDGTKLPSGEKISDIKKVFNENLLGVILTCISPENFEKNFHELKSLNIPCGFKFNAFETTQPKDGYTASYGKSNGNPNEFLGQRKDLTPEVIAKIAKKFQEFGANILGGCCETSPAHIEAIKKII